MRPRGNFRLETCSFPPITLNFSKTEFMDTSFNQLKKLKLVNTCKLQSTYEQYILREFINGNTDWQVADQQNLKLIKLLDFNEPAPYVVPYDFDYTGMVNATYAIPADVLGSERIT